MDKQLFDDKMSSHNDMRWDGGKGGPAWKSRVQSYFWSKVPALLEILKWAEKHHKTDVTEQAFDNVVGHFADRSSRMSSTHQYGGSCRPASQDPLKRYSGAPRT